MVKHLLGILLLLLACNMSAAEVLHDISTGSLHIAGNSTENYIVTGSTTENYIDVDAGYTGTITFRKLSIVIASGAQSPVTFHGVDNASNLSPVSNVDIVLEGKNYLEYAGFDGAAVMQVDQGTQINIRAITTWNNYSGTLEARQKQDNGGAAIGARNHLKSVAGAEAVDTVNVQVVGDCTDTKVTAAGGNIVISSGVVTVCGSHGAGIGGGMGTFYDGIIVIYGGVVNASTIYDSAGIGSGCPTGEGVINCCTANSAVVILPPARVSAQGKGASAMGGAGIQSFTKLGVAGVKHILYFGDPYQPKITVRTEDYAPNAAIYADLSEYEVSELVSQVVSIERLNMQKVRFGATDSDGLYTFRGLLSTPTTFSTDANSTGMGTYGMPYTPKEVVLTAAGEVVLEILKMNLSLEPWVSIPLEEGYSATKARENAFCIKLRYNPLSPMTNVRFGLAKGIATDFKEIIFLASDSATTISTPTTFTHGDVYYIKIPLKQHKLIGLYRDSLQIAGTWENTTTDFSVPISQLVIKRVHADICDGDSVVLRDTVCKTTGEYLRPYQSVDGNDSIILLDLRVHSTYAFYDTLKLCQDDLPYTWRDKVLEETMKSGDYVYQHQNAQGCDSTVYLNLRVIPSGITQESRTICATDLPLTWRDTTFAVGTKSGLYVLDRSHDPQCPLRYELSLTVNPAVVNHLYDEVPMDSVYEKYNFHYTAPRTLDSVVLQQDLQTIHGCDSTVILHLKILRPPFLTRLQPLPIISSEQDSFQVAYKYSFLLYHPDSIVVVFDEKARKAGFVNTATYADVGSVTIPLPKRVVPDIYQCEVQFVKGRYRDVHPLEFMVRYPASVLEQHWNDVLALRDATGNGGFRFEEYQWYKNDSPLAGETQSYLYVGPEETLDFEGKYSVLIRRVGEENKIFTCSFTPTVHHESQSYPTLVETDESMQMPIRAKAQVAVYNLAGICISRRTLTADNNQLLAPSVSGSYLVRIVFENNDVVTYKMIVR